MNKQKKNITYQELEDAFGTKFSKKLIKKYEKTKLEYEDLSLKERDDYILHVINTLVANEQNRDNTRTGEHRLQEWERGWTENLNAIKNEDTDGLVPRYHGKRQFLHWNQKIIKSLVPSLDYKIHTFLVDSVIETYLSKVQALFEFGCGPAYHLLRAREYNANAKLVGLDWTEASQKIIEEIRKKGIETNIEGYNFNFFSPDYSIEVPQNSGFITVAALEQVGDRYEDFIQFIIAKKPKICVHLEPIDELLDENNLIDRLCTLYFRKRNYLSGFLPRLRKLEKEGKIKILKEKRTFSGSYFIEGHSLIVWYPL
jgi:hypothetical protein